MKFHLKNLFNGKVKHDSTPGIFADFFLNATPEEKKEVFLKAARKANEDQKKFLDIPTHVLASHRKLS
ncbi:MAG: hypothetical protein ABJA78_00790 [Ferruginibacter sp.]